MTNDLPAPAFKEGDRVRFFSSPHMEPMRVVSVQPDGKVYLDRWPGPYSPGILQRADPR